MAKRKPKRKLKKSVKKFLRTIVTIILLIVIGVCGFDVGKFFYDKYNAGKAEKVIEEIVHKEDLVAAKENEKEEKPFTFTEEKWQQLREISPEFIGYMAYDDEFISEPIVQGADNDYFLHRYIDGTYSDAGSVFVDFQCSPGKDTNTTIYGHNVEYDKTDKFTPLLNLVENQEEYEKHSTFKIYYKDYVAEYVITNIYRYNPETDAKFNFKETDFEVSSLWKNYADFINERNLIANPKDTLKEGDRFITLQTCRDTWSGEKVIFTCKETSVKDY